MADDRYGTSARTNALERQVAILGRHVQQLEDTQARLVRELRQLRVTVAQLQDRDKWVETYVANEGGDPFAALGPVTKPREQ